MKPLLISFVSWFLLVASNVPAQEVGSAAAANFLADAANRVEVEKQRWQSIKKITLLKSIPPNPPDQGGEFSKAEEGWVGDVSYWDTEVLDIENEKEMLLKIAKEVIWLKNYPTKEFTTGQKVIIVGPVKAGATKSYKTIAGGQRTVRTFTLVAGEELAKYEEKIKQEQIESEQKQLELAVKKTIQSIIWGEQSPRSPKGMDSRTKKKYKEEIEQTGRYVKAAKIVPNLTSPMSYDQKRKRIEFDSEESRTKAQDHLKALSSEIPK